MNRRSSSSWEALWPSLPFFILKDGRKLTPRVSQTVHPNIIYNRLYPTILKDDEPQGHSSMVLNLGKVVMSLKGELATEKKEYDRATDIYFMAKCFFFSGNNGLVP